MRLELIAHARTEGEVLADADVVLDVDAALDVLVGDVRVADALGETARRAREIRLRTLERVGAEIVVRVIRPVVAAVEQQPRSHRVDPADVVEIRLQVERLAPAAAAQLLATDGELLDHPDGPAFEHRL
jgi:hypothetical protein